MEGSLWIDILNAHVSRSAIPPPWEQRTFLSSKSSAYAEALKVLKRYTCANCDASYEAPGGAHYIRAAFYDDFTSYFLDNFRLPRERPAKEIRRVRPSDIQPGDVSLDGRFYERIGIPYDQMTQREQQRFEEVKDVHHEEMYGHIRRFTDTGPAFISDDREACSQFSRALRREARAILSERNVSSGRHARGYNPRILSL